MNPRLTALASLVLGLVLALAFVACSDRQRFGRQLPRHSASSMASPPRRPMPAHPPQKDIENPLPCRVEIDALRAGGKITNSSGAPADYKIIVVWEQDGTQLATNTALIDNVAPGLTSSFEVSAPGRGNAANDVPRPASRSNPVRLTTRRGAFSSCAGSSSIRRRWATSRIRRGDRRRPCG